MWWKNNNGTGMAMNWPTFEVSHVGRVTVCWGGVWGWEWCLWVQNADSEKDLMCYKNNNGTGIAMNWPTFEESHVYPVTVWGGVGRWCLQAQNAHSEKDLIWWKNSNGTGMAMN